MALATVAELKSYLSWPSTGGAGEDTLLSQLLDGASAFVEGETGRQFQPEGTSGAPVSKTLSTRGRDLIQIPDLRQVVTLTLNGVAFPARPSTGGAGYELGRVPATSLTLVDASFAINPLNDLVISGVWGHNPVPADVKDATLVLAARRYAERKASFSDSVQDLEGGTLAYFRAMPAYVKAVIERWTPLPRRIAL